MTVKFFVNLIYLSMVVSNIFNVQPYLGKILVLTHICFYIFQTGWNHQLDMIPLKSQDIFGGNPSYTFAHLCLRMDSDFVDEGHLERTRVAFKAVTQKIQR